jgi:hypothetical protein
MVSIGFDHPFSFLVKHPFHRSIGTDLIPHSRFGLQVKPHFISRDESSFGWAPGMKPHMVQSPALAYLKERFPVFDIGWRVSGQWKIAAMMSTAKDHGPAVESKLVAHGAKVTQTNCYVVILLDPFST